MIGLFCFDGPLYKDKNGIYCNITLTNEMFSRYLKVVDKLIIVVRTFNINKTYLELNMKPLTLNEIEVIEINNFNTIKGFLVDKRLARNEIKKNVQKADLIFARMPSITSNLVLEIVRGIHKPYLVEVGGCAWDSFWHHGLLGKLIAPLMYYAERKNVKEAKYAIYVTKKFLQHRYPNNNITTNCSNVYLQLIDNRVLEQRIKKIEGIDFKHLIFGQAVNSIDVKYKGEHFIIKALGVLKKEGIIIDYQVVGPGKGEFLTDEARKYGVFSQLKLMGTMTKEEIFAWNKKIDVYVQPSLQEGLPRSVIEAMSTGCPAIGSNIAGIPELLDNEYLFNPNNGVEIVNAIKNILNLNNMKRQAIINFNRAKEYNINEIEKRRQNIFKMYLDFVKGENR